MLRQAPALPPSTRRRSGTRRRNCRACSASRLRGPLPRATAPAEAVGSTRKRRFPRATAERCGNAPPCRLASDGQAYLVSVKGFTRWLGRTAGRPRSAGATCRGSTPRRTSATPAGVAPVELGALLRGSAGQPPGISRAAGRESPLPYLWGWDGASGRGTGFPRARVLALDAEPTTVVCRAAYAKNGKTATQPLPGEIAEALRGYLAGKPAGQPIWPGSWHERAADMSATTSTPRASPMSSRGQTVPCMPTSTRCAQLRCPARPGRATLKQAMQLARHSDPKLTMAVYGRAASMISVPPWTACPNCSPVRKRLSRRPPRPSGAPTGHRGAPDADQLL